MGFGQSTQMAEKLCTGDAARIALAGPKIVSMIVHGNMLLSSMACRLEFENLL